MGENANLKNKEVSSESIQDVFALLKKMQCQLDSMEKKLDLLTQQSKPKTFKGGHPSKPYKDGGETSRFKKRKYEGKKEEGPSEGKFYHGHPFGKKKDSGKSSFKKNKKSY